MPAGEGAAWKEADAVFRDGNLAWIFRPTGPQVLGLCEAPLMAGRLEQKEGSVPEVITGVVDRLLVGSGRVDIIDYKTNRGAGDPATRKVLLEHYGPQLELYAEAVQAIFPGREVRRWLLFTDPDCPTADRLAQVG